MDNKAKFGSIITLQRQDVEVQKCENCNHMMVNLDEDEVRPGDLYTLKRKGIRLSNPHTSDVICINCELDKKEDKSFLKKVTNWFDDDEDDDDTSLFSSRRTPASTPSGGSGGSGFSFGGFGGGGFSGGGASRGF